MSISSALGEPRTAEIPAGTLDYRERGSGPPVVFVHGVGVNGDLWRRVAPELAGDHRCLAPDLPFGAHSRPLRSDTDMSLPGLARIVADFLEAVGLEDATVVANDTGGAVAQWLAGHHPDRVGRLLLTSCDAFDRLPPPTHRYLKLAGRLPPLLWLIAQSLRLRAVQRLPIAYGWTTRRPIDPAVMRSYTAPVRRQAGVRRDLARLLRAADSRHTYEAADALPGFEGPALVLWAAEDKLFPPEHGRRLAELLPKGRFATISDSRTFIPEDQPRRLAAAIGEFLAAGR
jgi:pimeloyl-ACP methyl ester carboxylesterase